MTVKKPYLIAEIGINHNGDINLAKKLIDVAQKINLMQLNLKKILTWYIQRSF